MLQILSWVLWGVLAVSLGSLAWPMVQRVQERVEGWKSQQSLQAEWNRASQKTHNKEQTKNLSRLNSSHKKLAFAKKSVISLSQPPKEWPIVRLICPVLNLDAAVVQGIDDKSLRRGPGHDPASSAPGEGNCVIAAHRNMAGWWFYHLDMLEAGDIITLKTPTKSFTYRVETMQFVSTKQTSLLRPTQGEVPRLTLYSCTLPKTEERVLVVARLQIDY